MFRNTTQAIALGILVSCSLLANAQDSCPQPRSFDLEQVDYIGELWPEQYSTLDVKHTTRRGDSAYLFADYGTSSRRTPVLIEKPKDSEIKVWKFFGASSNHNWSFVSSFDESHDLNGYGFVGIFDRNWCIDVLTINLTESVTVRTGFSKPYYSAEFYSALLESTGIGRITVVYPTDRSAPDTPIGYYDFTSYDGWRTWKLSEFTPLTPGKILTELGSGSRSFIKKISNRSELEEYLEEVLRN